MNLLREMRDLENALQRLDHDRRQLAGTGASADNLERVRSSTFDVVAAARAALHRYQLQKRAAHEAGV